DRLSILSIALAAQVDALAKRPRSTECLDPSIIPDSDPSQVARTEGHDESPASASPPIAAAKKALTQESTETGSVVGTSPSVRSSTTDRTSKCELPASVRDSMDR